MKDERMKRHIEADTQKVSTFRKLTCWLIALVCCIFAQDIKSQEGNDAVLTLTRLGFENVGCAETESERVFVLQNSAYRVNGIGLAKAIDVIQKQGMPVGKDCRIVVLDNNIPQISLLYHATASDTLAEAALNDWEASYELGNEWKQARKVKLKNRSLFKVDILVYPQVAFRNLVLNKIYDVLVDLNPTVEVSFWKGMKLAAQVKVPVYNDYYGLLEDKVHPGHLTLSQRLRLPSNIFAKVTAGYFNADQYGVDVQLWRPFKDERFAALARVGYTGLGYWNGFRLHYDTSMTLTWTVGGSFYWTPYNTQLTVKCERYLLKEVGVKAELIRHFRYCSIGFYAMKAQHARANGGFRFQVLLPPYGRYKRHGYLPRINTSPNMGIVYNAGNEQLYYRQYKAEASDNIMEENSFNPYFIKSELLNY